ncbi:hypothetical protein [Psychrosphaera algicola]|uniref:Uncharacterized protein n=1 Tax=Psychrosphaera algicola TaxID=3023714 RepID=A0ABT5FJG1_9GAMM|nr:hypothetical protein [Psychrosphaera sp. G1-22]MDC2891335.1 hypothetical protein [Psychrosphaera sp. G1-22]
MKYSRFVALGALFVFFISTNALAITPSAAQIEQLKQLPREQQVALAKQYGVDINDVIPSTNTTNNYQQERQVSQPARVENAFSKGALQQTQQIKDIESTSQIDKANKEQALKLFGYDIFSGQASGFEAMANMPVPIASIFSVRGTKFRFNCLARNTSLPV